LFIIQDDILDWSEQSAVMGDIYGRSYLTIMASGARSVHHGFLTPRHEPDDVYCGFAIQNTQRTPVYFIASPGPTDINSELRGPDCIDFEPLQLRAWALQERLLSSRNLIFSAHQMFWECEHSTWSEMYSTNVQDPRNRSDESYRFRRCHDWCTLDVSSHEHTRSVAWMRVIEDFTRRGLTFSSDRLAALSGIASKYQRLTADEYIASHWESTLLETLLWLGSQRNSKTKDDVDASPSPSWSWISKPGPISFHTATDEPSNLDQRYDLAATLLHYESCPSTPNPYGEVSYAMIEVRGRAYPTTRDALGARNNATNAQEVAVDHTRARPPNRAHPVYSADKPLTWWDVSLDYPDQKFSESVWLLVICIDSHGLGRGLALTPSLAKTGHYIRIGRSIDMNRAIFEDIEPSVFRII
jgi:hypothetical protein